MAGKYITYHEVAKARGWNDIPEHNWGRAVSEIAFALADPALLIPIGGLYAKSSRLLSPGFTKMGRVYEAMTKPLKKIPVAGSPLYLTTHPFKTVKGFVAPIWEGSFAAIEQVARKNPTFYKVFGTVVDLDKGKKEFIAKFGKALTNIFERHGLKGEEQMMALFARKYIARGEVEKLGMKLPPKITGAANDIGVWFDEFIPIAKKRMADDIIVQALRDRETRLAKKLSASAKRLMAEAAKGGEKLDLTKAYKQARVALGMKRVLKTKAGEDWAAITGYVPFSLPELSKHKEIQMFLMGDKKAYNNVLRHLKELTPEDVRRSLYDEGSMMFDRLLGKTAPEKAPKLKKGTIPSFEFARTVGAFGPGKRAAPQVMMDYVSQVANGLFWDGAYPLITQNYHLIKDPHLREIYWGWFRSMAGVTERESSRRWAGIFTSLGKVLGKQEWIKAGGDVRALSKVGDAVATFQYMCKLGLSPLRFPMQNATQPVLTLLPVVGVKNFMRGFFRAQTTEGGVLGLFSKHLMRTGEGMTWKGKALYQLADEKGIFQPIERALAETTPTGFMRTTAARYLTAFQRGSEGWNRIWSFASGLEDAVGKGIIKNVDSDILKPFLQGRKLSANANKAIKHAIGVNDLSQFPYTRVTMPLFTATPGKRLVWQFKNFLSYYINYLDKLKGSNPRQFAHAIAALIAVGGTGSIPFYDSVRPELMRMGVNLPEFNTLESITRGGYPVRGQPGINIASSLEPFNIPRDVSWIGGPTFGPLAEVMTGFARGVDVGVQKLAKAVGQVAPAPYRLAKGVLYPEVKTRAEKKERVAAIRSIAELLYLRPTAESQRYRYLETIGAAMQAGDYKLARGFIQQARREGVKIDKKDIATIKARITKRMHLPRSVKETIGKALSGELPFGEAEKMIREGMGR